MDIKDIVTLIFYAISIVSLILSIALKTKNPKAAKTFEQIYKESLTYGNSKANKYFTKQCKKNNIDLSDKSINIEECDSVNQQNISNNNQVGI